MGDAVIVVDADQRVELINEPAAAMLRVHAPERARGRSLVELVRNPELLAMADRAPAEGVGEAEFDLAGTPRRRVLARLTPRSEGGLVVLLRDVSELRRLETIRQDFVANVSHELRTPVAVVLANAETLLGGALDRPDLAERFLAGIQRNAERMGALIADLLDLSRIEAGAHPLDIRPVSVEGVFRQAAETASATPLAAERQVTVTVDEAAARCPMALADADALAQVVQNFTDNGVKYTRVGGVVTLRARPRRREAGELAAGPLDVVRIEVEDDGPGIALEHRSRLFERFYRVDTGRSREMGGTGLALSIVKHLVLAMGGAVGLEGVSPHGARFWVELPAAPAEAT